MRIESSDWEMKVSANGWGALTLKFNNPTKQVFVELEPWQVKEILDQTPDKEIINETNN